MHFSWFQVSSNLASPSDSLKTTKFEGEATFEESLALEYVLSLPWGCKSDMWGLFDTWDCLNALDMYVLVCICHVFCSLIQYAIVLILGNFKIKVALVSCHKIHPEIPTDRTTHYTRNQGYGEKQQQHHMNTFDLTSLIVFPMFFILCVILYCISYI